VAVRVRPHSSRGNRAFPDGSIFRPATPPSGEPSQTLMPYRGRPRPTFRPGRIPTRTVPRLPRLCGGKLCIPVCRASSRSRSRVHGRVSESASAAVEESRPGRIGACHRGKTYSTRPVEVSSRSVFVADRRASRTTVRCHASERAGTEQGFAPGKPLLSRRGVPLRTRRSAQSPRSCVRRTQRKCGATNSSDLAAMSIQFLSGVQSQMISITSLEVAASRSALPSAETGHGTNPARTPTGRAGARRLWGVTNPPRGFA